MTEEGFLRSVAAAFQSPWIEAHKGLVLLAVGCTLGGIGYWLGLRVCQRCKVLELWKEFDETGRKRGLLSPQRMIVRELLEKYPVNPPVHIWESRDAFDHLVGQAVAGMQAQGKTTDQTETLVMELKTIRQKLGFDRVKLGEAMKTSRELPIKQMVHVLLHNSNVAESGTVLHIDDAGFTLKINYTHHFDDYIPKGTRVQCSFHLPNDARYRFEGAVKKPALESDPLIIEHCDKIIREQDRQYYRLTVDVAVKFSVIDLPDITSFITAKTLPPPSAAKGVYEVTTLDISGGGMGFITDMRLETGQVLLLHFSLDGEEFNLLGEVVVARHVRDENYKYGVEFTGIDENLRDHIVAYIHKKERERLEKKNAEGQTLEEPKLPPMLDKQPPPPQTPPQGPAAAAN